MVSTARLEVLGNVSFQRADITVPIGGPKPQLLLSLLVANIANHLSSARLIEALWGQSPPRSCATTLQSHVSRLRAILSPEFEIRFESAGYQLEVIDGVVDSGQFEELLESSSIPSPGAPADLELALALWRGPAFGAFASHHELVGEAMRLDELRLVAIDRWAAMRMSDGDHPEMVGELEGLVARHPLRESFRRFLVLALYRAGRQAEALRTVSELRTLLRNEAGLGISPRLQTLEQQILADDPSLQPERSPSSPRLHRSKVPELLGPTSFVGRDPYLSSLGSAIEREPVVTIIGPGGVGKTRLAMRVAGNLSDRFEAGVVVVELASLRDPSATAQVIANALDIQQRQHRTIETTIEEFLAGSQMLLLLDNCEHVTNQVAPLVDRLRSTCPHLRILATSRQPLGLAGEYVEVLDPLGLPSEGADTSEQIRHVPAVELFVARAVSADRSFELNDRNAGAVAAICNRLEGIPLALELAAARLRTVGVGALAERLAVRTDMIGQLQRGADQRHRSVRDSVEWSYELLAPHERQFFEQLSVFAGGFDLGAVEAICVGGATQLLGLVDKSLVSFDGSETKRYRMLEPLREYGLGRLTESGKLGEAEDRHLQWFHDLARSASRGLDGPNEGWWAIQIGLDFDNFRAAFQTAIRSSDAGRALSIVASLRESAFRSMSYELTTWAETALKLEGVQRGQTAVDSPCDNSASSTVLGVAGYGAFVRGDMEVAVRLANQALQATTQSVPSESGLAERVLGNALFYLGETRDALTWTERMTLSAIRSGDNARIAHARYMSSVAQTSIGDAIQGAVTAGEAKAAATACGSLTSRAQAAYALGLALEHERPDEALRQLDLASRFASEAGNRWLEGFALTEVYWLKAKQGSLSEALVGYSDVIDIWFRGGDWANQYLSLRRVFGILVELGAYEAGAVLHGALSAVGATQALPFVPSDAERLVQNLDLARSSLEPDVFDSAVRSGAVMGDKELVSFARNQIALLTG